MDTLVYAHIIAIAQYGNIAQAAEHLFLSRSTLSRQLLVAEKELGFEIFKRISNGLVLTTEGIAFLDMATRIIEEEKDGMSRLSDITRKFNTTIRVGLPANRSDYFMPAVMEDLHKQYPLSRVEAYFASGRDLAQALSEGRIDFAVSSDNWLNTAAGFDCTELIREEYLVLISRRHPMAERAGLEEDGLHKKCKLSWFRKDLWAFDTPGASSRAVCEKAFLKAGIQPEVLLDNCKYSLLYRMVARALCNTIALDTYLPLYENEIAAFSLEDRVFAHQVIAFRKGYRPNKVEQAFAAVIEAYYRGGMLRA